jgi:hypothetical protein
MPERKSCSAPETLFPSGVLRNADGAFMEPSGRNQWQPVTNRNAAKRPKQAKTVATGCDWLPIGAYGKEGVDGSSPSEGLPKVPANPHFVVVCPSNTRTHSGHICGTRDAPVTSRGFFRHICRECGRVVDSRNSLQITASVAGVGEILTPSQQGGGQRCLVLDLLGPVS